MRHGDMQACAAPVMERYFDAERALLSALAGALGAGIGQKRWARDRRKARAKIQHTASDTMRALTKWATAFALSLMAEAWADGRRTFESDYRYIAELTLKRTGAGRPQTPVSSSMGLPPQRIEAELKTVEGRAVRNLSGAYRRIVAQCERAANADAAKGTQAVQSALNRYAKRGIMGFVSDESAHWAMSEYASLCVDRAVRDAQVRGYTDAATANGFDLVLVSAHGCDCDKCGPWEGRILSLTGKLRDHPGCAGTLAQATNAGLFHPNCWHDLTLYVPGVTTLPGVITPQHSNEAEERAAYYERMTRKFEREGAVALTDAAKLRANGYARRWRAAAKAARMVAKHRSRGG